MGGAIALRCSAMGESKNGALAQLGEHLLCKQGVIGSIPIGSTRLRPELDETPGQAARVFRQLVSPEMKNQNSGVGSFRPPVPCGICPHL